jgi:DNA-directed RNA polymerase specialized sigma24 family protein
VLFRSSGPGEPRDEHDRIIPLHERNAATAAWHLARPGVLHADPQALRRYLIDWLGWKDREISRDYEHALYLEITEELESKQGKKISWLGDPDKTVRNLHVKVRQRARALKKDGLRLSQREKEQRRKWNKKVLLERNEESAIVAAFALKGEDDEFLRQARKVLSNQQFQVLKLRGRGRSTKQIAGELGVEEGTVYTYERRARQSPRFRELSQKWFR